METLDVIRDLRTRMSRSIVGQEHVVERLPIGVASGGFRAVIEHQLEQIGVTHLFSVVVAAEDTEKHKPEPDVFLEAAQRLEMPPESCCVLEDSDLGIEAARRAGMGWVDVRPFYPDSTSHD